MFLNTAGHGGFGTGGFCIKNVDLKSINWSIK